MDIYIWKNSIINLLTTNSIVSLIHKNVYFLTTFIGFILLISGMLIPFYARLKKPCRFRVLKKVFSCFLVLFDRFICTTPLKSIREAIKQNLALFPINYKKYGYLIADAIIIGIFAIGLIISLICLRIGQLWYCKVLILIISMFIPYYLVFLGFEIHKYKLNKNIPQLIDEFRSAFIKCKKIRPAFRECSMYVDKSLGALLVEAADSSAMTEKLYSIREGFNNSWFNIFVTYVLEYRDNGGELLEQLYKLARTMGRSMGIEKKRNKRLIVYETFVVLLAMLSIPAVIWINTTITGSNMSEVTIPELNTTISRIIVSSITSLVVMRVLRAV